MNLGELVTELRDNILHDRSDRVSGASDQLWSDATLVRYINEAERRFALQTLVLRDATTPEVTQVTIVAGQTEYTLHSSVIGIVSAKVEGDTADLARSGHGVLDTYRSPDPIFWDTSQFATLPPGKPLAFTTDETLSGDERSSTSVVTMRLWPKPSAAHDGTKVLLRVVRLPTKPLKLATSGALADAHQTPEIPMIHHLEMLDWAAYLALRIVDLDKGAPARAAEFRQSFEEHVRRARTTVMRKLFAPQPWGFGRSAWSWEK